MSRRVHSTNPDTDTNTTDHGALTGLTDDDHTQYRLESENHSHASSGLQGGVVSHDVLTDVSADDHHAKAHAVDGADHTGTLDIGDTQFPAPTAVYPLDVAAVEADGTATTPARSDHIHAHGSGYLPNAHHAQAHAIDGADHSGILDIGDTQLPAPAAGYPVNVDDSAEADGSATTVARSDHKHALRLRIEDEGSTQGSGVNAINFAGAGVSASVSGEEATVTISGGAGASTAIGRKTSDQTFTSNTTLANITELVFAIAASEAWTFEFDIFVTGDKGGDAKIAVTVPAGATVIYSLDAVAISNNALPATRSYINTTNTGGTAMEFGLVSTTQYILAKVRGIVVNGGTAGDVQIQGAQRASHATATNFRTNSYFRAEEI